MARILPHYSLCPLIEQGNFLGLMKDVDCDTAVVTVNANFIGRYKISDPKLLSSWNSKGNITSACVYDSTKDRYVAIFNENDLRIWTAADEFIDKLKKYKFTERLFKLLICPKTEELILVYRNGNVSYLDQVIENRKNTLEHHFIHSDDKILSCEAYLMNTTIISFVLQVKSSAYKVLSISPDQKKPHFSKSFQSPGDVVLLGHCFLIDKNCQIVTLWSDGKLYRDQVHQDSDLVIRNHCATFENIDLNRNVVLKALSPYQIAICGGKDDGILLIIYSTKYNLTHCQQYYENQQMLSQLWNFDSKLFLIIGHHLVVAQYVEENRKLSTLIGSNVHQESQETLPEAEICKNVVPSLLEANDIDGISNLFNSQYDIPDSVLIDILFWSLKTETKNEEILNKILYDYIINDIRKLRSVFNVDLALVFLDHIMPLNNSTADIRLVKWASLFIDAFYSQLIMSNDAVIVEKLKLYMDILKKECDNLDHCKQLMTMMSCVKRKKIISI